MRVLPGGGVVTNTIISPAAPVSAADTDEMGTRHGTEGRGQNTDETTRRPLPGRLDREEFERAFGPNPRPFGLPDNRPVWTSYLRAYRAAVDARAYAGESGAWTR